jgi:hypothetical protein
MKGTGIWIPPPGHRRRGGFPWKTLMLVAFAVLLWLPTRAHYPLVPQSGSPRREAAGAFHVHTTASDGRLSADDVAAAAARAGLDFVVITDHNVAALPAPAYAHGVLLVPAEELTTPGGHLLALGTSRALTTEERTQDPIGHVNALGGFAVLAHPVQEKMPWSDWAAAPRARGLELYSADTFWRDALRHPTRLLPALLSWPLRPVNAVLDLAVAPGPAYQRLLGLSSAGPFVSLCSHDAHGLFPPAARSYESEFRAFSLHLPGLKRPLAADPVQASRAVLDAIAAGGSYCGFDAIAPANGFAIEGAPAMTARAGDSLRISVPDPAPAELELRVHGSGKVEGNGRTVRLTGPGAVEIEVWAHAPGALFGKTWRPWIVAGPIRVLPREAVEAKAQGG